MAFVNEASRECVKSELDLAAVQPMQTSIEEVNAVKCLLVSSVQKRTPLNFHIPRTCNHYIDMANVMRYVHAKITQGSDANLAVEETVAPVNLMLHSMFSQVDTSLY